jgi:transketolase
MSTTVPHSNSDSVTHFRKETMRRLSFPITPERIEVLQRKARRIRATCVRMAFDGREGHLTSALSCVDLLVGLYGAWLRFDPKNRVNPNRDRFLFSKGHAATALYAVLADQGLFPPETLATYAKTDSPFPNHPCRKMLEWLEISSGSLGHGLGIGTGMAYSLGELGIDANVVVLMSDGECNEGSVWESAAFACAHRQDRLVAIVDNNNMQAVGRTDQLLGHTSFEDKFRAFGWAATTINGNDMGEILDTLSRVPLVAGKPTAIIAKTVGGKGVSFMEDKVAWHYRTPSQDELKTAFAELGESPLYGGLD